MPKQRKDGEMSDYLAYTSGVVRLFDTLDAANAWLAEVGGGKVFVAVERLAAAEAREDDLRALCEEINHALWPDPDASHDTSEAPHAIDEMRRSFAAAEAAKEDAIADARAQFDKYMDCHKAYRELQDKLSAAEARVGELTNQLALRLRAENCDKEELLAECIENRQRLAAAEAAVATDRINLVAWALRNMDQFGCFSGDCPHDLNSECIQAIIDQYVADEAAAAGGGGRG